MAHARRRKLAGLILSIVVIAISTSAPFRAFVDLPESIRLTTGREHDLGVAIPFLQAYSDEEGLITGQGWPWVIKSSAAGKYTVELRLFGLLPLRRLTVEVLPEIKVVPGGHSIGVLLHANGVIVTNVATVVDAGGRTHRPARDAGLQAGDILLTIDGHIITGDEELAELVHQGALARGVVEVQFQRRDGSVLTRSITPVRCGTTGRYRLGVWVRDTAAGVGTLTFYEPEQGIYAALGHVVTDQESGQPIAITNGRIVASTVTGVEAGRRGQPGEIVGSFLEERDLLGTIGKNCPVGIIGRLYRAPENPHFAGPIPVALSHEVKSGPATIYTVVDGRNIRAFSAEIAEIRRDPLPHGRLVIKITDPELLRRTGGIVQGMSGSPIVQDGRLVGAVTHVLVSDPSRGYGIAAEWMVIEAGLHQQDRQVGALQAPAFLTKCVGNMCAAVSRRGCRACRNVLLENFGNRGGPRYGHKGAGRRR